MSVHGISRNRSTGKKVEMLCKLSPRESQRAAFDFWMDRQNALLGMDMGTGKTLVAIAGIASNYCGRALVLAPKSVVANWPREIEKCWPSGSIPRPVVATLQRGSTKQAARELERAEECAMEHAAPLIVIVNYDRFWRPALWNKIIAMSWQCIIADESQRIKSPTGKASKAAAKLGWQNPTAIKCGLSGTPIDHSKFDAFGQYRFLNPNIFGQSWFRFKNRYAVCHREFKSMVLKWINCDEYEERLGSILFRVKADDVLDLPDAVHIERYVDISPEARRIYRDLSKEFISEVASGEVTVANALAKVIRLQQVANGILKLDGIDEPQIIDDAKERDLIEVLEDLPKGEPVIVFCRFVPDLAAVGRAAEKTGRTHYELSGSCDDLALWQRSEDGEVLGVQIQSGGVGVDLSRARYVYYYSRDRSLGNYEQSLARTRRPSEHVTPDRTIFYYHGLSRETIDITIARGMAKRKEGLEAVIEAALKYSSLSPSEGTE